MILTDIKAVRLRAPGQIKKKNKMSDLTKKIDRAIHLLRQIPRDKGPIELAYSGGKDSDCILRLAQMAGIPFDAIYKNTTIDPPGTIAHCKENGVRIINPNTPFLKLIERIGFPTRFRRFCCSELKEYKIHDVCIQGMRREESRKRAERYKEPVVCRFYGSKKNHVQMFLPLLEWTNDDVAEFIDRENIKCHQLYYRGGQFDVNQRLGCIGCPLAKDRGLSNFKLYPKMMKRWIVAIDRYMDTHPTLKLPILWGGDPYKAMCFHLLCDNYEDVYNKLEPGLFGVPDYKGFLERTVGIDLTI